MNWKENDSNLSGGNIFLTEPNATIQKIAWTMKIYFVFVLKLALLVSILLYEKCMT